LPPVWICLCEAVNSGKIREVISDGARSVAEVGRACGAGTECGKCKRSIICLIEQHAGPNGREMEG
jgi:bacterioferritin-associated ferredoxin